MKTATAKSNCCGPAVEAVPERLPKMVLVGSPNVGKSLLFNRLTGTYVSVSNYPGTTVEVSRGKARWNGREYEVIDTPGMYSLRPLTEEERVTRSILLQEKAEVVLVLPSCDCCSGGSYLFRIGHTRLAVDGTIAGAIYIRRGA